MIRIESRPLVGATYNIRGWGKKQHDGVNAWENRKGLTIDVIRRKIKGDIVGLQEFSEADNYAFYKENLPEFAIHLGDPVDNGWSNPILYNPKILIIKESRTIWLHPKNEPKPAWEADEVRSANLVVFDYKPTPESEVAPTEIVFVNEHQANDNPLAQLEGSKKVHEALEAYTGRKIVLGDKNCKLRLSYANPSSNPSPYGVLFEAGFEEVYLSTHPDMREPLPPTFHDFPEGPYAPGHIDGIMVKGFKPLSCDIIKEDPQEQPPTYSSDHWAERAELALV